MANSFMLGANSSIAQGFTNFSFKTPPTAITVKVCVADKKEAELPATPAALTALLTGSVNSLVFADGEFDRLSNRQLSIHQMFPVDTPAEKLAKKIVSYTQDSKGAWIRAVLETTQKPGSMPAPLTFVSIEFTAPITAPGFFTIE